MSRRLQDDPMLGLAYLITMLLTLAGVAQSVEWILASRYSTALLVGLSVAMAVMLGAYLRRPPAMRFFNISRLGKVVSLTQHQDLDIGNDGWARLAFAQSILFLEPPEPDDYRDKLHCDEQMDFDVLDYRTPDADVVRVMRETDSLVAVYLRPLEEAEPLVPWRHEFSFALPENVGPDYYCVRIAIHTPVGRSSVRVTSAMPLERVICFREPHWVSGTDYDKLARYALDHRDSDAPPAVEPSASGFCWEIERPHVGEMYNLTFFFEGGVERFRKRQHWRVRFAAWWARSLGKGGRHKESRRRFGPGNPRTEPGAE